MQTELDLVTASVETKKNLTEADKLRHYYSSNLVKFGRNSLNRLLYGKVYGPLGEHCNYGEVVSLVPDQLDQVQAHLATLLNLVLSTRGLIFTGCSVFHKARLKPRSTQSVAQELDSICENHPVIVTQLMGREIWRRDTDGELRCLTAQALFAKTVKIITNKRVIFNKHVVNINNEEKSFIVSGITLK